MSRIEVFFEYLKTIILTIVLMSLFLALSLFIIQKNIYETTAQREATDDSIEYYLVGVLIEKNKYLEIKYPENYKINLKLGILYEISKDYPNSEAQYKIAIKKAPFDEYKPESKLANLYIRENKLEEAQALMDKIDERPNKALIIYKAETYFKIAEKYYSMGDYLTAITKYQRSLFYYERVHSSKIKEVKNSLASAYVYLAEALVDELKISEATNALLTANELVDAPIVKYKLALLLMKDDPDAAYKYFEDVLKEESSLIDFDVYYNFLMTLSNAADKAGNISEAKLYSYKAKKFKEYFEKNIMSVGDLRIEYAEGKMTVNRWNRKCNLSLKFQLKNTSGNKISSVFTHVTFKDRNEIISEYSKQIIDDNSQLSANETTPTINIKTVIKMPGFNEISKNITAEIYISKTENSYKIHLITVPVIEIKKTKKNKPKEEF